MPGRVKASLEGNSTKVSKDLASAILTYGIENLTAYKISRPQYNISSKLDKAVGNNYG